jgi:hypothetical protein
MKSGRDVRVATESGLPILVAQYDNGRLARRRVVDGANQSAERGIEAEDGEIAAGHEQAFAVDRLTAVREIGVEKDAQQCE